MKKKDQVPAPAPTKQPAPAKQQAPPQGTPQQTPAQTPGSTPAPANPDAGRDFSGIPTGPQLKLDPTLFGADGPGSMGPGGQTLPPDFFKLRTDPIGLIDWSAMRGPFYSRGTFLDTRDIDDITLNWRYSVHNLTALGLPLDLAVKVTNLGLPMAYDYSLSHDFPNAEERMDQAFNKLLPAGKAMPTKYVVPIITPDTLNWVTKKLIGKDVDFHFN
jgi:hypothetical protein